LGTCIALAILSECLFLLYLLTIKAAIKQTCITLLDVWIEKNLEYLIFRQVAENATLSHLSQANDIFIT
jgi:hypothetical protein